MLTTSKESSYGSVFHNAEPDSMFGKIYRNNMDENSFGYTRSNGPQKILSKSKTAFWNTRSQWKSNEFQNCMVNIICKLVKILLVLFIFFKMNTDNDALLKF